MKPQTKIILAYVAYANENKKDSSNTMTSRVSQPLLPFAFCVSGLENTRCWHQIFYILSKNLVFWFQFQVFFLNSIYSCWEICEGDIIRGKNKKKRN